MAGIEAQHRGEQNGIERSVMQGRFFQGAERVREAVHGAKPLLERQAAFESAHHQLRAGLAICPLRNRPFEVAHDAASTVQRDRLGRRVEARREEGLDAVRERIHPGRCREARGQPERQVWIADGALWDQVRANEAELAPISQIDESSTSNLTSGSVPAVVGIAITGATRSVMRPSPPSIAAYWASGSGWVARTATALARSIGEPPPKAMIPSHVLSR